MRVAFLIPLLKALINPLIIANTYIYQFNKYLRLVWEIKETHCLNLCITTVIQSNVHLIYQNFFSSEFISSKTIFLVFVLEANILFSRTSSVSKLLSDKASQIEKSLWKLHSLLHSLQKQDCHLRSNRNFCCSVKDRSCYCKCYIVCL